VEQNETAYSEHSNIQTRRCAYQALQGGRQAWGQARVSSPRGCNEPDEELQDVQESQPRGQAHHSGHQTHCETVQELTVCPRSSTVGSTCGTTCIQGCPSRLPSHQTDSHASQEGGPDRGTTCACRSKTSQGWNQAYWTENRWLVQTQDEEKEEEVDCIASERLVWQTPTQEASRRQEETEASW